MTKIEVEKKKAQKVMRGEKEAIAWIGCIKELLPEREVAINRNKVWKEKSAIFDVLNHIISKTSNIMIMPYRDFLVLEGCSDMDYYLDLKTCPYTYSIIPISLTLEYLCDNEKESYFRLECLATFSPRYNFLESAEAQHLPKDAYRKFGYYGNEYPIRPAVFAIFNSESEFTYSKASYFALHNKLSADEFRYYVETMISK